MEEFCVSFYFSEWKWSFSFWLLLSLSCDTILNASCFSLPNFYRLKQQTSKHHLKPPVTFRDHLRPSATTRNQFKTTECSDLFYMQFSDPMTLQLLTLHVDNQTIKSFLSVELLRIHLDEKLKFDRLISSMCNTDVKSGLLEEIRIF